MKDAVYYVDDWSTERIYNDPWVVPENNPLCLRGKVNGKYVRTSPIVSAVGRRLETQSGSVYFLQNPAPAYKAFVLASKPHWDENNPIEVIG